MVLIELFLMYLLSVGDYFYMMYNLIILFCILKVGILLLIF